MEGDDDMPEIRQKTDWRPVYIALVVHLLGYAWYFGTQSVRLSNVEHNFSVADSRGGFATHDDLKDLTAAQTVQDQQRDMRMNAIDGKVDGVITKGRQ